MTIRSRITIKGLLTLDKEYVVIACTGALGSDFVAVLTDNGVIRGMYIQNFY